MMKNQIASRNEYFTIPVHNLEEGWPSLDEARRKLLSIIQSEKQNRHPVIKIIHGYGSSGVGGTLYHGLRKSIRLRKKEGKIRDFIIGEEFGMKLLNHPILTEFPGLVSDEDFDKGNPGITIVVLY